MNQEIAALQRWGRPEIQARAAALGDRIISIWPGPTAVEPGGESTVPWDVVNKALAELPAGSWTTYGDIAALIGSHPVPVGVRLATRPTPHAHRVLQVEGTVSPNFRWLDPSITDDPRDLLRAEGVEFDEHGRASSAQRIHTEELARLAGISSDDLAESVPDPDAGQDATPRDRFLQQLADSQGPDITHATLVVLDAWATMGGTLSYGRGRETSCFLMARGWTHESGGIWPGDDLSERQVRGRVPAPERPATIRRRSPPRRTAATPERGSRREHRRCPDRAAPRLPSQRARCSGRPREAAPTSRLVPRPGSDCCERTDHVVILR
jgi:alkylated DNA nucleotide flippase Atl1